MDVTKKGNLKRETESLLIATQNNNIRTNYLKARMNMTRQNSKDRLCGNRDETINHIISECCKLAQKVYKTRYDWVGKEIHWELYKKLTFDYTNKWYIPNPESVLENETRKLRWDFANKQIALSRPDQFCGLCCSGWLQSEIKRKWKERKVPGSC